MIEFLGFATFVVVFVLLARLRGRMRLVELRVYGASPIPLALKAELEGAARAATADAYARSVAVAAAAAAERAAANDRAAAEWLVAEAARRAAADAAFATVAAPERSRGTADWRRPAPEPAAPDPGPAAAAATAAAEPPDRVEPQRFAYARTDEPAAREPAAAVPAAPKPKKINWELFAGGRLMNVAGAIALVVGFGLLLKYAFDQNWIDAQLRIVSGIVLGAVAIGAGMALHAKRKTWFVHGVFGIGIGVWYASGYAAFAGYHLVPAPAAYAFMTFVTIAAFAIALRYDSIAVALIGWAGGFLTPFVAGSTTAGEIGLASYLVILDSGLLAISLVRRRWFMLQPLALAGSYVTAVAWYLENGAQAPATVSAIAIASLWLVFFTAEAIDVLREPGRRAALKTISSLVNLAASGICLFGILGDAPAALETVTALAALGYAAVYAGVLRLASGHAIYRYLYAFSSAALAGIFIVERFRGVSVAIAFGVVALAVAICTRVRWPASGDRGLAYEALVVSFAAFAAQAACTIPFAFERFWSGTDIFAHDARFDLVFLALAIAGFAIDRLWRHASVHVVCGLVARIVALFAVVAVERLHTGDAPAGIAFAIDAIALALVERALRSRGFAYGLRHESAVASAAFLALGAAQIAVAPFGPLRDVATSLWIAAAFALGLFPSGETSRFANGLSIAFRCAGVAGIAELEWTHAGGYVLATWYAASAILVAAIDRAMRFLKARDRGRSGFVASTFFLALAAAETLARDDTFASLPFRIAIGSRDVALLACIVAVFAVDRLLAPAAKPVFGGTILRIFGLLGIALLDAVHVHGNALATTFAFEAMALAGIDRALRSARSEYAPAAEFFGSGVALVGSSAIAFALGAVLDGASVFVGRVPAFSYGGVDLALVTFAVATIAYARLAGGLGIFGPVVTVLRQSSVAAAFIAVSAHLSGFERADGFALLAIGFTLAGSRLRARDLRVDGAIALVFGLLELAIARSVWTFDGSAAFGPVLNESFVCFALNALATIVASEAYRRSVGSVDVVARGGRIAGALLAVVGITLDVRDAFERAAAALPAGSLAHARLENLEQLTISIGWILASIALVLVGVRLRVREFRLLAIGLFDLTILKAFFVDVYALDTPYRIVSFIVLGATLMGVSYLYGRVEKRLFGTDGTSDDGAIVEDVRVPTIRSDRAGD